MLPVSPFFSVVVPVYNVAPYLEPCVRSLLAQDWGAVEIILVDDCSTDESGAIADQLASANDFVRVIRTPVNSGVAAARNLGLDAASGKYVIFVDGDDCLLEHAISGVRRHLERVGDVDLILCRFVSEGGVLSNNALFPQEWEETLAPVQTFAKVVRLDFHLDHCWHYVINRSLIEAYGIRFIRAVIAEDSEFIVKVIASASTISTYYGDFYWYRVREGSLKNSAGVAHTTCFLRIAVSMLRLTGGDVASERSQFLLSQIRHALGVFSARLSLHSQESLNEFAVEISEADLREVAFLLPAANFIDWFDAHCDVPEALRRYKEAMDAATRALLPNTSKRNIYIYCTGPIGEAVVNVLNRSGSIVLGAIDDSEKLAGSFMLNVPIQTSDLFATMPEQELSNTFVIVCTQKKAVFKKISASLMRLGLGLDQIVHRAF
jgi:glycosyltransferase involved in cell wall biosynthesis